MEQKTIFFSLPWKSIGVMALLESVTVPWVAFFSAGSGIPTKNIFVGFCVGFLGAWISCYVIKRLFFTVTPVFVASLYGGFLLAGIFFIQKKLFFLNDYFYGFAQFTLGFLSAGGSTLCLLVLYRWLIKIFPFLSIVVRIKNIHYQIISYNVWILSLLVGLYEGLALPIIMLWQFAEQAVWFVGLMTGCFGGCVGAFGAVIFLRYSKMKSNCYIQLKRI